VTSGYSLSNSVSVVLGPNISLVENFLGAPYSLNVTQTWTMNYATAHTFQVPGRKYGTVVSNPLTTRYEDFVAEGCIRELGTRYGWQADVMESIGYEGLD
jgi:hypothetical protein